MLVIQSAERGRIEAAQMLRRLRMAFAVPASPDFEQTECGPQLNHEAPEAKLYQPTDWIH